MKRRGLLATSIVFILVMAAVACQRQKSHETTSSTNYEVFAPTTGIVPSPSVAKMIDTVALLESYPEEKIAEFSQGSWAIAVKNLTTGYTYYYDSDNTFLGRRK